MYIHQVIKSTMHTPAVKPWTSGSSHAKPGIYGYWYIQIQEDHHERNNYVAIRPLVMVMSFNFQYLDVHGT